MTSRATAPGPGPGIEGIIGLPPGVTLRSVAVADVEPAVVAVVLASSEGGPLLTAAARGVGTDLGIDLDQLVEAESLRGDAGAVLVVPLARTVRPTRLLVVGIGAGRPGDWRAAGAALARRAGSPDRLAVVAEPDDQGLRAFVEGLALGSYRMSGVLDRAARTGLGNGGGPVARRDRDGESGGRASGGSGADGGRESGSDAVAAASGPTGVVEVTVAEIVGADEGRDEPGVEDFGVNELAGNDPGAHPVDAAEAVEVNSEGVPTATTTVSVDGDGAGTPAPPGDVIVLTDRAEDAGAVAAVAAARAVATGVYIARDLVNTPSLVKSPRWLADRAVSIATAAGLKATVLGPEELAEQGFGGLHAVGAGSPRPPYLVRLEYDGPPELAATDRPVTGGPTGAEAITPPAAGDGSPGGRFAGGHRVLVGKGITFDSGGLSLKPPVSMIGMKTDMSGAAAVLGAMTALPALRAPGRVTGLLCLAENMIGGTAMRPGDVITCWGGTTVEVLNTDAEGRLVLADGLAYAAGALGADVIVDLATLTGAIAVALGRRTAGLFSSDDGLAAELSSAADRAGERVWRLPLVDEYRPAIDSPVADLANMGRAMDVGGGSITAALFLREFAGRRPWAHLDIAGTARSDSDDGEISRGGTGWGVRTLLTWLSSAPGVPAA